MHTSNADSQVCRTTVAEAVMKRVSLAMKDDTLTARRQTAFPSLATIASTFLLMMSGLIHSSASKSEKSNWVCLSTGRDAHTARLESRKYTLTSRRCTQGADSAGMIVTRHMEEEARNRVESARKSKGRGRKGSFCSSSTIVFKGHLAGSWGFFGSRHSV